MWIRYGGVGFVAAVARTLNVADVHCNLLPRLQPFLKHPVVQVDQEVLKKIQSVQICITLNGGATLAAPRWPWHLTFALGWLGNLSFCIEIMWGVPWISQVQSTRVNIMFPGAQPWNVSLTVRFWEAFPSFLHVHLVKKCFVKIFCREIKLSLEYFSLREVL